jgi:putative glycosyltransferase (TIGR04348 family)
MAPPSICLVTPALAKANNGNWQTASRWARFLRGDYRLRLVERWDGSAADLMIALHARRSAQSIADWAAQMLRRPLLLVLTGTDLYQDIAVDAGAQRSLALADALVVLNELGCAALPAALRAKCNVCLQSAPRRAPAAKTELHLRALMVGHLREVKSPQTYFDAAQRLAARDDIVLDHVGAPLDAKLGELAQACARSNPRYRWLGSLAHRDTRARIQRAHVLVHASLIEGGAHVVIEAVTSGTPVLASRIAGNVGLLGADYGGYFEPGESAGLAALLQQCRDDPDMLPTLKAQCDARAERFTPANERRVLLGLVSKLLENRR